MKYYNMLLSFITTIKICKDYEFLIDRINLYILNIQHYCEKYDILYEILILRSLSISFSESGNFFKMSFILFHIFFK